MDANRLQNQQGQQCEASILIGNNRFTCRLQAGHEGEHKCFFEFNGVATGFNWADEQAKAAESINEILCFVLQVEREEAKGEGHDIGFREGLRNGLAELEPF